MDDESWRHEGAVAEVLRGDAVVRILPPSSSVSEEAQRLRRIAESGPIGKRQSSFDLYNLLGRCMGLAERCSGGVAFEEMRSLVSSQPGLGNRRYVERASDEFTLVCRFVFGNLRSKSAERSNASRYAHCLREARKRGLSGSTLASHLRDNGGINALFLGRPVVAKYVSTKSLRLTRSVSVLKGGIVRLVIRHLPDNTYEVLECTPGELT